MGKVAQVPCVICKLMNLGDSPSLVHHLKYGQGASDRASDWLTVAVCEFHHVGEGGIHTLKERGLYLRYRVSELDLLALTIQELNQ